LHFFSWKETKEKQLDVTKETFVRIKAALASTSGAPVEDKVTHFIPLNQFSQYSEHSKKDTELQESFHYRTK
jgi:hypothetical protein